MGVIHAEEIAYVFGEPLNTTKSYTEDEKQLSKQIMRYWANFARTGSPNLGPNNTKETFIWRKHKQSEKKFLILDVNSPKMGKAHRADYCTFWNTLKANSSNRG